MEYTGDKKRLKPSKVKDEMEKFYTETKETTMEEAQEGEEIPWDVAYRKRNELMDKNKQKKIIKKSKKTKKYTITLKNSKGKAVKKAKVTLKVKGKTYKAKTNSKGKATFKITKLTKKGTYKATIKYKGNKYYKKATKKVKIKIKQVQQASTPFLFLQCFKQLYKKYTIKIMKNNKKLNIHSNIMSFRFFRIFHPIKNKKDFQDISKR